MSDGTALSTRIKLALLDRIAPRPFRLPEQGGVVSFSFDDAPRSAAIRGAELLEAVSARGTYYVATGLMGGGDTHDPIVDETDLRRLVENGHEIGCHTRAHIPLRWVSGGTAVADCGANTERLVALSGAEAVENFAYPFGLVGPLAKAALRSRYSTLRGTDAGINHGTIDLSNLRGSAIYSSVLDRDLTRERITSVVRDGGWLIFVSHDVRDDPTAWGTTPADLHWVLSAVQEAGLPILSVRQACRHFGIGAPISRD